MSLHKAGKYFIPGKRFRGLEGMVFWVKGKS